MRSTHLWLRLSSIGLFSLLPATPAPAQVIDILHTFTGGAGDGQDPAGALLLSGSTLYGMTSVGGSVTGGGTLFQVGTNGTGYNIDHAFIGGGSDGRNPYGSLVQSGTTLYGVTQGGGSANVGTIFQFGINGSSFSVLHQFSDGPGDGAEPFGSPILSGSTIYGMTMYGGSIPFSNGLYQNGTIFKINNDGSGYSVQHSFGGPAR